MEQEALTKMDRDDTASPAEESATATEPASVASTTPPGRAATPVDVAKRVVARSASFTKGLPARRLALPFLLIGLLLALRALLAPAPTLSTSAVIGAAAPLVNHYAPDIALAGPSGKQAQLSSLRGDVVMLTFWSASCTGCQSELSSLEQAYLHNQVSGFVVIGLDISDNAGTAATYAKHAGVTYPIVLDEAGHAVAIYHVTTSPTSFLIDRHGVIRALFVGPTNGGALDSDIAQLVSEK